jgi:hypothetical protein
MPPFEVVFLSLWSNAMATRKKTINKMFTDDQLNVGKVLIMTTRHKIPLQTIERLTRSTLTELDASTNDRDCFLEYVVENSLATINPQLFNAYDIYIADDVNASSMFLRTAEPESFVAAVEFNATNLKSLHNASLSHKHITNARKALLRAKVAHNELVMLTKKFKALNCFAKRTSALNAAAHSYGTQTLKKLEKDIAKHLSKTW